MDYSKIYNQLITRALSRELCGYSEKHHIKPKCLGGDNSSKNIVKLTAREHFLSHLLLVKIYPKNIKLKFALKSMSTLQSKFHNGQRVTNRLFGKFRELSKSIHTGLKRSDETRKKISIAQQGKIIPEEARKNMSDAHKGQVPWHKGLTLSKEHKDNISKSLTGRKLPNHVCEKMSKSRSGKPQTDIQKINNSLAQKESYKNGRVHGMLGKNHETESKKRISESNRMAHQGKKRVYKDDGTWTYSFKEKT